MKREELQVKITKFFIQNPNPSDEQVHDFAERLGVDKHKFEEAIYRLLTSSLKEIQVKK